MRPAGLAILSVLGSGLACGLDRDGIDVALAASTERAVQQALDARSTEQRLSLNANASSRLARQIVDDAPADLFLSADEAWADAVAAERPVLARVDLLHNRIVEVHAEGARGCTALADPDHVPAGRYAKLGLEAAGRWPPADLVPFPTGPAAARAVANGDCAAGFVYATDALASGLEPVRTLDVRATYPLLLLHERGRPVYEALQSPAAREAFVRHGFEVSP